MGDANEKTTATDPVDFSEGVSTAVVVVAPPSGHSLGFNLIQKNPFFGKGVFAVSGEKWMLLYRVKSYFEVGVGF